MTTVAIHQPNYLPWLGYFDKITRCDVFVFLDSVAYTHNDYRNRNRIKTSNGVRWLTVPVVRKGALSTPIRDIEIDGHRWQRKHWETLRQSYGRAPYFEMHKDLFEHAYTTEWSMLANLDEFLILGMCDLLGIGAEFVDSSKLNASGTKTDLLVSICREVGADRYLSGEGAREYMDRGKFEEAGIELVFQEFECPMYSQLHGDFVPNLSAVDFLFNCGRLPTC